MKFRDLPETFFQNDVKSKIYVNRWMKCCDDNKIRDKNTELDQTHHTSHLEDLLQPHPP